MNLSNDIELYIEKHSSAASPLLQKLYRETHLKMLNPRMLSGHIQGMLLSMISEMCKPSNILEIGTFTGYSAICLAKGLKPDGILHTIEINDETAAFAESYFAEAGLQDKIKLHVGDACEVIKGLNTKFDLVFIDGEKREYPTYFHLCADLINPGGYIIADNVLWDGKVVDPASADDTATRAILEFNKLITEDVRFENFLLPLRDGLMIARRV